MNRINQTQSDGLNRINVLFTRCRQWSKYAALGLALLAGIQLPAQTVTFVGPRLRATIPVGVSSSLILSNSMACTTNGSTAVDETGTNLIIAPVTLDVTGLPAGMSYSITNFGITNLYVSAYRTNNATYRLWLTLVSDGTVAEGTYTFSLNANGGATNNLLYTLDVAHVWNGTTNAAAAGSVFEWSVTTNWLGDGFAGTNANSIVVFTDWGGQTNSLTGYGSASTNYLTSSIIDNDYTINSLRFAETNGTAFRYHTLKIADGKKLTITGTGGFSVLRDWLNELAAINSGVTVTVFGTNGAGIVITNESADFAVLLDNQQAHQLNLGDLDNFDATVSRIAMGDAEAYPNYANMDANSYGNHGNTSYPRKMIPTTSMARTNVIKALYVGPENYTNSNTRRYSITAFKTVYGSGTTSQGVWNMGISNLFLADSICFGGANYGPGGISVRFNPIFSGTNCNVVFRNTNGGRMSLLTVGDGAGFNENGHVKANVDLGGSGRGYVDVLVDWMLVGADSKKIVNDQNPTFNGTFGFGGGIIDANTVNLGYQVSGVHTNLTTVQNYQGYCTAVLTVSNTAVFKVNDKLELGYTTEVQGGTGPQTIQNRGQVNVNRGGTMMVNRVLVGGETKGSGANTISIASTGTNISTFILSNTIAGSDMYLSQLTMGGGSVLQVNVDGNLSAPYIYVTNNAIAAGNFIRIGSLNNVTYVGGVAQFPLISYRIGTPTIPGVIMPSGFVGSGSIIPDGAVSAPFGWNLYVSTNPPNTNLLWRAPANGTGATNWDTSSKVWYDRATFQMTNFHNGDWVEFDDAPGYCTNINQTVSILLPSQVTMSNTVLTYKFTGSGVQGGGVLTKRGTGTLEIGGTFSIPMTITEGKLTNNSSGSIVSLSVSAGASVDNAGIINGNVTCGGQCYNPGTINGALSVSSGGVVTNLNLISHGAFTLATNTFLYNGIGAIIEDYGNSTVASNATLINDGLLGVAGGTVNAQTLTVSGTVEDTGASGFPSMVLTTFTLNPGSLYIPGGDGIGASKIRFQNNNTAVPAGRVQLSSGSTNILKVDPGAMTYTVVGSGCQDFGPSQSSQQQNGCTLIITNVTGGTSPFAAGQYFKMFTKYNDDPVVPTGTSTNSFPIIVPTTPGPGLIWDLRYLWGNIGDNTWGYIGVAVPPVVQLTNSFSFPDTTNITCQFDWPSTNYGWRLQTLVTPNTVGLSGDTNYNWTSIAGSWTNTTWTLTNNVLKNGGTNVFFRLVYP